MQITLDKIASVTSRMGLSRQVEIATYVDASRGALVAVQALEEKSVYGELELVGGRMARIIKGDVIVGALGERQALKGFVGHIPQRIAPGDVLHILNMGGVIGKCSSANAEYGQPLRVRVLGAVLVDGEPANIAGNAVEWQDHLSRSAPIVLLSGTCMNSGKTTVACEVIRVLKSRGYRLAAAKIAGVATQRDLLNMQDHGAVHALSFSDAGLPSTTHTDTCIVPAAKGILAELNRSNPDAIVVELGDGIMGHYGVDLLLKDAELMSHVKAHILCANDLVAAWGGLQYLGQLGVHVDCVSGPATDNSAGVDYIEGRFGKPATNGRVAPEQLADMVEARLSDAGDMSAEREEVA